MRGKKNPHAVALGRLGAKKGALARAAKLTPEERKSIARKAAQARWSKHRKQTEEDAEVPQHTTYSSNRKD